MLKQLTLKIVVISVALIGGIAILGYPHWSSSSSAANRFSLEDEKIGNKATETTPPQTISSEPPRYKESKRFHKMQNSPVWIVLNQNGNTRKADLNGYINVAIRETYKIEIYSPKYTSAVSVKIDGVPIIDGLICDRNVTLERPHAIAKQFIVLEEGNPGLDREGGVNNPDLGLIEVTFVPIKHRAIELETMPRRQSPSLSAPSQEQDAAKSGISSNRAPVGTGLSGSSSQEFVTTNEWVEAPEIAPTYTKKYRLVGISSSDPVTLHNMKEQRTPQVDPAPPRL
jgi:hypothetical protein